MAGGAARSQSSWWPGAPLAPQLSCERVKYNCHMIAAIALGDLRRSAADLARLGNCRSECVVRGMNEVRVVLVWRSRPGEGRFALRSVPNGFEIRCIDLRRGSRMGSAHRHPAN